MRLVIVHVEEEQCRRGPVVRFFTIPCKSMCEMTYLDVLTLGNLKLLKSYDFWIDSEELPHRIENRNMGSLGDLLFKIVEVRSAGGRLISLRIIGSYHTSYIKELLSRPIGIRVIGDCMSMAFSETLYVKAPCKDPNIDLRFIRGNVSKFLIGSSVKNYFRSIEILKEASEKGEIARRKVVLIADFAREFTSE